MHRNPPFEICYNRSASCYDSPARLSRGAVEFSTRGAPAPVEVTGPHGSADGGDAHCGVRKPIRRGSSGSALLGAAHPKRHHDQHAGRRYLIWYHDLLRAKHRRTLIRVFERPTPADIRWEEMESLLRASGVEVVERSGSRVGLSKGSERIVIHRPHPRPSIGRATVREIVAFLKVVGVEP